MVAVCLDQFCSTGVSRASAMLTAVEFDDKLCGSTGEIDDVRTDLALKDEFFAFKLAIAKALPQSILNDGTVTAQFAGYRREAFFAHSLNQYCRDQSSTHLTRISRISSSMVRLFRSLKLLSITMRSSGMSSTTKSSFSSKRIFMSKYSRTARFADNNIMIVSSNA